MEGCPSMFIHTMPSDKFLEVRFIEQKLSTVNGICSFLQLNGIWEGTENHPSPYRVARDSWIYWDILIVLRNIIYWKMHWENAIFSGLLWNVLVFFGNLKFCLGIPGIQNSKFSLNMAESYPNRNMILCTGMYWYLVFLYTGMYWNLKKYYKDPKSLN